MSVIQSYEASPTKRRRRTKAEMLAFSNALANIVTEIQPCMSGVSAYVTKIML